ncbi:IS5/IS1182 family transposase, partial [Candidatus Saccharibacteria bacterium]|nr:IS5/IS1182 family transposase [Candidatus Saccharibacteria bacterium]
LEEWKNEVDYHRRSLIENLFYRWKTIFGDHLKSRKEENQYTEQALRARIINKFNELGLPKYELAN